MATLLAKAFEKDGCKDLKILCLGGNMLHNKGPFFEQAKVTQEMTEIGQRFEQAKVTHKMTDVHFSEIGNIIKVQFSNKPRLLTK